MLDLVIRSTNNYSWYYFLSDNHRLQSNLVSGIHARSCQLVTVLPFSFERLCNKLNFGTSLVRFDSYSVVSRLMLHTVLLTVLARIPCCFLRSHWLFSQPPRALPPHWCFPPRRCRDFTTYILSRFVRSHISTHAFVRWHMFSDPGERSENPEISAFSQTPWV
jgi:hypothetical protein